MGGNKKEFDKLFNNYKDYVYKICYQYTRSSEDALDLTQEIFIKVYKNIEKIKQDKDLKPWIRKISVNTCLNYKRDKKKTLSLEFGEDQGFSIKDTLQDSNNTENTFISDLTNESLKKYINELRPEIKMALLLQLDGLSYKEIASSMQCPEGTIKTYIYKGRQILLKKLKADGILEV